MDLNNWTEWTVEQFVKELEAHPEIGKEICGAVTGENVDRTVAYLSVELFAVLYYIEAGEKEPEKKARDWLQGFYKSKNSDYNPERMSQVYERAFDVSSAEAIRNKLLRGRISGTKLSDLSAELWELRNPNETDEHIQKVKGYMESGFQTLGLPTERKANKARKAAEGGEKVKKAESLLEKKIQKELQYSRQIILTGAPGTGKTFTAQRVAKEMAKAGGGDCEMVQFHPTFDYSDFVEGLRPVNLKGDRTPTFVRMDGVFKKFCRKVAEDAKPDKKYFFLIDEINRADLAKVFGDLMYCLEYRVDLKAPDAEEQKKEYSVKTPYANLDTYDGEKKAFLENDVFAEGFYVPANVYIIGTMNDIDRSVESVDFSMRRRFQWIEVKAEDVMANALAGMKKKGDIAGDPEELEKRMKLLNDRISGDGARLGLSDAYHVGPAYLKGCGTELSEEEIWEHRIKPLLREYLRGRKADDTSVFLENCRRAFVEMKEPDAE